MLGIVDLRALGFDTFIIAKSVFCAAIGIILPPFPYSDASLIAKVDRTDYKIQTLLASGAWAFASAALGLR